MPDDLRVAALDALDQTMAVGRSLVLTCRSAEYEQVKRESSAVMSAATVVRLEPVARQEAITYLSAREGAGRDRRRYPPSDTRVISVCDGCGPR